MKSELRWLWLCSRVFCGVKMVSRWCQHVVLWLCESCEGVILWLSCVWFGLSIIHLSQVINLGKPWPWPQVMIHLSPTYCSMFYGEWQLGLFARRPCPSHSCVAHVGPKQGKDRVVEAEPRLGWDLDVNGIGSLQGGGEVGGSFQADDEDEMRMQWWFCDDNVNAQIPWARKRAARMDLSHLRLFCARLLLPCSVDSSLYNELPRIWPNSTLSAKSLPESS